MNKKLIMIVVILFLSQTTLPATSLEYTGHVTKVLDGDTIEFSGTDPKGTEKSFRVRLNHIDAPEKDQFYGKESTELLKTLVWGRDDIFLECSGFDLYRRMVCEVRREEDGMLVNLELVKQGLAWHYTKYSSDIRYSTAEEKARTQKIGLWSEGEYVLPPWEFRKQKRKMKRYLKAFKNYLQDMKRKVLVELKTTK